MQYCGAVPEAGSTTAAGGRSTTLHSRKRTRQAARCWENPCTRWLWSSSTPCIAKGRSTRRVLADALTDGDIATTGWSAVPLTILTANSSFAAEAARSAGVRSRTPSLMFATSSSVAADGSIA